MKKDHMLLKRLKRGINHKNVGRHFEVTIGILLASIAFNLFFLPQKIVIGGNTGIAVIGERLLGLKPSLVILIYVGVMLIIGAFLLGFKTIKHSIYGSLMLPLFIHITSNINRYINIDFETPLIFFIIGAVIMGVAFGLIYKTGFNAGGTDILKLIVKKHFGFTMGKSGFIINGIIVLVGGFMFGWNSSMYALVILYISGIVTDKIILGISNNKAVYIATDKDEEIKEYVLNSLNRGATVLKAKKEKTNEKQNVLMCVVPTKDHFKLTEGIKKIDEAAFFVIVDAYEVMGEFKKRKIKL